MARTLTPRDMYPIMNALVAQATGETSLTVTNGSDFVSAGELVVQTGNENVMNALSMVLGRTLFAVRPYGAKLQIINALNTGEYTHRLRKISYYNKGAEPSGDWNTDLYTNLADGYDNGSNGGASTASMWEQHQALPLELQFGGSNTIEFAITRYENQIKEAFRSPEEFLAFVEGILTEKGNEIEMAKEAFNRMNLLSKIAATFDCASYNNGAVIDLIAGFNASVGQTYTRTVVLQSHLQEFLQYFTATFKTVSDKLTYNTINYHWDVPKTVGGDTYHILRHTPYKNQRAILYKPFFTQAKAKVFSEIFNPEYLESGAKWEGVDFWQSFAAGPAISFTPGICDMDPTSPTYGTQITGSAVSQDYILGVLYDEDAIMTDFMFDSVDTTPLEARKRYRSTYWHALRGAINDPTENFVVFYLGAGGP